MDEKVLASLILILQKHANAIRKLQFGSIALMTWAREEAIRAGVSVEEFEKRFLKHLSEVEERRAAQSTIRIKKSPER